MEQRLDRLGQIHGGLRRRGSRRVRVAVGRQFPRGDGNGVRFGFSIRLRRLGRVPPRAAGNDKAPPHRGGFRLGVPSAAMLAAARRARRRCFSIQHNYKTRTIRFSSEKSMGDLRFADCGDPDLFTRPLALESWRLRTPEDRRGLILAAFARKSSIIVTLSSLWG